MGAWGVPVPVIPSNSTGFQLEKVLAQGYTVETQVSKVLEKISATETGLDAVLLRLREESLDTHTEILSLKDDLRRYQTQTAEVLTQLVGLMDLSKKLVTTQFDLAQANLADVASSLGARQNAMSTSLGAKCVDIRNSIQALEGAIQHSQFQRVSVETQIVERQNQTDAYIARIGLQVSTLTTDLWPAFWRSFWFWLRRCF